MISKLSVLMLSLFFVGDSVAQETGALMTPMSPSVASSGSQVPGLVSSPLATPGAAPVGESLQPTDDRAEFNKKMVESVQLSRARRAAAQNGRPDPFLSQSGVVLPVRQDPPQQKQKTGDVTDIYPDLNMGQSQKTPRKRESSDYDFTVVVPEVPQPVELSNTDNNRFICSEPIKDVIYSAEKGMIVKFSGQNAFVKFKILKKSNGELVYAKNPSEMFIVCGDSTYNIIGLPTNVTSQTIKLSSGKRDVIKKNMSLMAGLPMEKKILSLIEYVHKDAIPDSFTIVRSNKRVRLYKGLSIVLRQTITIEGEGLLLKAYAITNVSSGPFVINEGLFLKPEMTQNTVAMAIGDGKMNLAKNESTKLYVVELTDGGTNFVK